MNDQSLNQNDKPVKPCIKCGASDRNASGKCRPCGLERSKKWADQNSEKRKKVGRDWYHRNAESQRAASRERYKNNPHNKRKKDLERYHSNPQKQKDAVNRRKERDPEGWKLSAINRQHNRRARVRLSGGKLSNGIVEKLITMQNGLCACCSQPLNGKYHLDHIMPLALGGTNTDDNVQLLLPRCNLSKGAKHPIDYMRSKGKLL